MKKYLLMIVAAALLVFAAGQAEAQGELLEFAISQACTDSNATISFGFTARKVLIKNDLASANEVYLTLASGTSTTSKVRFEPGEGVALDNANILRIGCITSATETATVYGGAWR